MNVDAGPPTGTGDAGPATGSSVLLRRVVPAALFLGVAVVLYALSIVGAGRLGSHTLQTLRAGSSWRKILRPADTELPYADKPNRARSQKDPWEIAPEAANATSPDEPVYVALCLPVKGEVAAMAPPFRERVACSALHMCTVLFTCACVHPNKPWGRLVQMTTCASGNGCSITR
jgi:hypothetical protein